MLPAAKPVIVVVALVGVVIVAVPLTKLHKPVPVVGTFPANVKVLVLHNGMSVPALEVVGKALFVKTTLSNEVAQTPFDIVHLKVAVVPAAKPVIVVVALVGVVMVAVPLIKLHKPVPTVGTFPANVKVLVLDRKSVV